MKPRLRKSKRVASACFSALVGFLYSILSPVLEGFYFVSVGKSCFNFGETKMMC